MHLFTWKWLVDFSLILWQSSYILKSQTDSISSFMYEFCLSIRESTDQINSYQIFISLPLLTTQIQTTLSNAILSRRHSRVQTLVCIFFQYPLNLLVSRRHIVLVLPLNMQVQLSTPNWHLLTRLHVHSSQ